MWRKLTLLICLGGLALFVGLFWAFGLVWNQTPSLPVGLWQKVNTNHSAEIQKGAFVTFCPPEKAVDILGGNREVLGWGRCDNGYRTFLKRVVGVPGDTIQVTESQVTVNGIAIDNSQRRLKKRSVFGAAPTTFRVPPGFVWLMATDSPWSFDSRYFGLVPVSKIQNTVVSLWTF